MALQSVKAFTEKMIDYAGLFPPAKLKLEDALDKYFKYSDSEYNWILSRFICPAKLLEPLKVIVNQHSESKKKITLSLLVGNGNSIVDFKINLQNDLNNWSSFMSDSENITAHIVEMKLPDELILSNDQNRILSEINFILESLQDKLSYQVFSFLEGTMGEKWEKNIANLIQAIKMNNEQNDNNTGFKLRTGGIEPGLFPRSEQIAFCIRECLDRAIPMKCTAGLHRALTHHDNNMNTNVYGFLNVFAAGIIAMRHNITNKDLTELLEDEDINNFVFTEDYFSWKGWETGIEDIISARKNLILSYGSCNFEEPVEELKLLNLL